MLVVAIGRTSSAELKAETQTSAAGADPSSVTLPEIDPPAASCALTFSVWKPSWTTTFAPPEKVAELS